MHFFKDKPLSLMIFIVMGGFSLFALKSLTLSIVLSALLFLALCTNCIFALKRREGLLFQVILLSLLCLSILFSYLYFKVHFTVPQKDAVIVGEILDKTESDYGVNYSIKCTEIDDKKKNVNIILHADKEFNGFYAGDIIVTKARISPYMSEENYDAYHLSRGFVASASHTGEAISVVGHKNHFIQNALASVRDSIHRYIIRIFGDKAGGMFLALLIGDKTMLEGVCSLDFRRIGISHILALSGQHLAILSLLVHRFLSLFQIDKKKRLYILCIFIVAYMVLTGFGPSVTRAGLMLLFSSVAFLLGNSHDTTTGLFCSVFLFVLVQPYAILDLSLLLSAFATFGVIRAVEFLEERNTRRKGILWTLFSSGVLSLFAMFYTSFISVSNFAYISILSPLTSFIFSLFIQIYIYAGLFFMLFGWFVPVEPIMNFLYQCIKVPANFLSSFEFGYFSTDFTLCTILTIILVCALLYYLLYPVKHKKLAFSILTSICFAMYMTAIIGTISVVRTDQFIYMHHEATREEQLLMKEEGNITYIDVLPSTASSMATSKNLQNHKIPDIDRYVLVGYTQSTVTYMENLLSNTKIHSLYLPLPQEAFHKRIYENLLQIASDFSIQVTPYTIGETLHFETSDLEILQSDIDESFRPIFTIEYKNSRQMYLSKDALDEYNIDDIFYLMSNCDTVIFGAKGKDNKKFRDLDSLPASVTKIILSDKSIYFDKEFVEKFISYGVMYTLPEQIPLK